MHLLLSGPTGLVGSAVLQTMLTNASITKVTLLSRRDVAQAAGHSKCNVLIHKDFTSYPPETMEKLKDVDGVVWALGISSIGVPKPEYEAITYTYPLAFARAISSATNPKPVNFVYVSGEGASMTPGFTTSAWGVTKGRAESDLLSLPKESAYANLRPYALRPAAVDPSFHPEIKEFIPQKSRLVQGIVTVLRLAIRGLLPTYVSPTRDLGRVLTELAMGAGEPQREGDRGLVAGSGGRVLDNVGMRRLAGI